MRCCQWCWMVTIGLFCGVGGGAAAEEVNATFLGVYQPPLPQRIENPDEPASEKLIDLGRMLYYEKRLSIGQDVSCNTCHPLDKYGVDGLRVSKGHKDQEGTRNSPTVYNAAGHFRQFWDGRAADVEEQAVGPILNPVEMAMVDESSVLKVLKSIPGYVKAFETAFPDADEPLTYKNIGVAIGAFERGLTTPSPWDKFLAGDKNAITDDAKAGFNLFTSPQTLCFTCHLGTYVGGNTYNKAGLVIPWPNQEDKGRFEITKQPGEMFFFKVPGLRNVAKTAPYFHDGSVETLDEAVRMMAKHQSGLTLDDEKVRKIVAWLETLTGEIPQDYIKEPKLPENGPDTPGPKTD